VQSLGLFSISCTAFAPRPSRSPVPPPSLFPPSVSLGRVLDVPRELVESQQRDHPVDEAQHEENDAAEPELILAGRAGHSDVEAIQHGEAGLVRAEQVEAAVRQRNTHGLSERAVELQVGEHVQHQAGEAPLTEENAGNSTRERESATHSASTTHRRVHSLRWSLLSDPERRSDLKRPEVWRNGGERHGVRRKEDERRDGQRRDDHREHPRRDAARDDQADALTGVGQQDEKKHEATELGTAGGRI
jgi:hypothetical protein